MFTNQVSLPKDYFKKDRRQYNNWEQALFRELIQNSYDAKAKNINISIHTDEQYHIVSFCDDGKGMSEKTIKNALLTMGGTEKEDDSVGGFGQAKIIIYFSHDKYEIHTKDNIVYGSAGEYSIKKTNAFLNGTKSVIYIDKNDTTKYTLENEIEYVVKRSNLGNTKVFIDDYEIPQNNEKHKHKRYFDIGQISFNYKEGSYTEILVRIGGVFMFSSVFCFEENMDIIFDVSGKSTEVFTANRDSLKTKYNQKLLDIINDMSNKKATIDRAKNIDIIFNEKKEITSSEKESLKKISTRIQSIKSPKNTETQQEQNEILKEVKEFNYFNKEAIKTIDELEKWLSKITDNDYEHFYPDNFSISMENARKNDTNKLKQAKYIKLAHFWNNLIMSFFEYNVINFSSYEGNVAKVMGKKIISGFSFSENDIEGSNLDENNIIKINIEPTKCIDLSLDDIMDIATHELAHIYEKRHNEDFILTEVDIRRKARKKFPKNHTKELYKKSIADYKTKMSA